MNVNTILTPIVCFNFASFNPDKEKHNSILFLLQNIDTQIWWMDGSS